MEKLTRTELEAKIYELYTECYEEPSDRRKVSMGKLWKYVSIWCKDYLFTEEKRFFRNKERFESFIREIGDEIYLSIDRCIKKDKKPKEELFIYFKKALDNAKNKSFDEISYEKDRDGKEKFLYGNFGESGIKEPKIIKQIRRIIDREEKELKHEELVNRLFELLPLSKETIHKHLVLMYENNGDGFTEEINNPSTPKKDPFLTEMIKDKLEDDAAEMIKDELESFLDKKQERTRDLYRALFTGVCIKEGIHYFRKIWPILDSEILEYYWKDPTVVPNDYDIYLIKRPNLKQESAESGASKKLGELTKELREAIIENHPEIYFEHKRSKYQK